jgi:glyoxylase-like metal-dependent hydrolase (beta-lactamase superfamily II)
VCRHAPPSWGATDVGRSFGWPASRPAAYGAAVTVVTGVQQKAAWDSNVMPPVEQVRPGLWSVPVPIPANPLRYVLVYVLELRSGVAIVDAGWNTQEAWDALGAGLAAAGGSVADVQAVLVTHIHPDHYGLAGRVREASGAWIGLHPADAEILQGRYLEPDDLLARMRVLLEEAGVPRSKLPTLTMASMVVRDLVLAAQPDVLFEDGRRVDIPGWDLRAIWTPGHSPGHVCFHSDARRLLLSGDHVLPRITSNIGVHSQQQPDPLGQYLHALEQLRPLPVDEVLPAHEYRFADLPGRLDEIAAHHRRRLAEIEALLAEAPGATAWDLSVTLTWSRPWDQIEEFMQRAAVSETLAHLVRLERMGRVVRTAGPPARFRLSPAVSAAP